MNAPAKLGLFGAVLGAVFTASLGVGAAIGPVARAGDNVTNHDMTEKGDSMPGMKMESPPGPAPSSTANVDGYAVTLSGALKAGKESDLTFSFVKDGKPVTDLAPYLGAYGHLVALRVNDLAYFVLKPDGAPGDGQTRSGPTAAFRAYVPTAGAYRLFLEFEHGGVVRTAELSVVATGASS